MKLFRPSITLILVSQLLPAQGSGSLTTNQWREDLAFVVERIQTVHPDFSRRISVEEFLGRAEQLHADFPNLDDRQAAARMMGLVASIRDGHTSLDPHRLDSFKNFLPLRFYQFSDGLFITCAIPELEDLVGRRVLRIGDRSAEEALQAVSKIAGTDNRLGEVENACYLSSVDALLALGIVESLAEVSLQIQDMLGGEEEISVPSVVPNRGDAFDYLHARRETEWPPAGNAVTAFPELRSMDQFYRNSPEENPALPLHARRHSGYWFQHLPERDAVFMQVNTITDKSPWSEETFREMYMRMFRFIDEQKVGHFILDLRFNTGGNGDILLPFVHEFIKRDHSINRSGRFYALVGRRSFSAAVMLAGELNNHTQVILVGEPAGAALNFFGDATAFELPNSGMELWVSARYWQLGRWEDRRWILPVEIPAEFSSTDYFDGIDPAMEAIFGMEEKRSIPVLVREESAERAQAIHLQRKKVFGNYEHWQPFAELEMNNLGYELLRENRREEARIVFAMCAERYPDSANVWDSLGEAQFALRMYPDALASYNRALEIDPDNRHSHNQRAMIERIKSQLDKK